MTKKALCTGINDYPYEGNDLKGCVNDANGWARLLIDHYDFAGPDVKLLTDSQATSGAIIAALKDLFKGAKAGDVLVWTNSSHGTYRADTSGDETYDEALCPFDVADNLILDDTLRELFNPLPDGVLTVVLDNCHSGTGTRAVMENDMGQPLPDERRRRFLSPALRGDPVLENPFIAKPAQSFPETKMNHLLIAGCRDVESSYDMKFGPLNHGALTYACLQILKAANYKMTYADLMKKARAMVKKWAPQTPQLEGKKVFKARQVFA